MGVNVSLWLDVHARARPDSRCLYDDATGLELTYADVAGRVDRLAEALLRRGIGIGDRVAMLLANSAAFLETFFAIARIGAIAVPINYRLAGEEIGYVLEDSHASLAVYSTEFASALQAACALLESPPATVAFDPKDPEHDEYSDLLRSASGSGAAAMVGSDAPLVVMYTSGTTGAPKGAVLTHGNMSAQCDNLSGTDLGVTHADSTVAAAPLFHIGGLAVFVLPLLRAGGSVVLMPKFDPTALVRIIADHKPTVLFMVPTMWQALGEAYHGRPPATSVRAALSAGAAAPGSVIDCFAGWALRQGYGMTEAAAGVCALAALDAPTRRGSVGRPLPLVQVKLVDVDGAEVSRGTAGEIIVRGPNVMSGYWDRSVLASRESTSEGWFATGDVGVMDHDGYVSIVDRIKDMVISGGENVYPLEVENVLLNHESIADVAVIGAPDEKWGEAVIAVVVPRPGAAITEEEIRGWSRSRLAHFKCPREVHFVAEIPRNSSGKILKPTLREQYGVAAPGYRSR